MHPKVMDALAHAPGLSVGPGLTVTFGTSETGDHTALFLTHPHRQTGADCALFVWLEGCGCSANPWRVVRDEPLTVAPMLLCPRCGLRGVIVEGEWRER